jgi:hypothetical protein
MGKKTSDPDPSIAANATTAAQIGQSEWKWFQDTYLPQQQTNQAAMQTTSQGVLADYLNNYIPNMQQQYAGVQANAAPVEQTELQQMQTAGQTGNQIFGTWNQNYAPLYGQIAQTAMAKGGAADQAYQAMLARGDVGAAFANQAGQNQRYLAQYGMSPTSGVAQALQRSTGISQAAQEASAQTAARQAAANLGWTYQNQAAQIGQGLLSAGNSAYQSSQQSGTNAIDTGTSVMGAGQNVINANQGAINTANAPIGSQATIGSGLAGGGQSATGAITGANTGLNAAYATQAGAQAQQAQGTGQMIGTGVGVAAGVAVAI